MKSIKRLFWTVVLLLVVGAGTYYPLTRHAVVYQSNLLILPKEGLSFKNTYLNLDKHPEEWCTVLQSPSLYNYFRSHHFTATMKSRVKCAIKNAASDSWKSVKNNVKKGITRSVDWVKRETPKQADKLKQKTSQGLKYLKQKAKEGLEQMAK